MYLFMWSRCPQAWQYKRRSRFHFRREENSPPISYHPACSALRGGTVHVFVGGSLCAKTFNVVPESIMAVPDIWSSLCLYSHCSLLLASLSRVTHSEILIWVYQRTESPPKTFSLGHTLHKRHLVIRILFSIYYSCLRNHEGSSEIGQIGCGS